MAKLVDSTAFLLRPDKPPLGSFFRCAFEGFFGASAFLLKTEFEAWAKPATTQIVNKFFWDAINSTYNHSDPHIVEPPYPGRRGLSSMRTMRVTDEVADDDSEDGEIETDAAVPPDGETRASLLLKSELSTVKAFERDARQRAKKSKNEKGMRSQFLPSPLLFTRKYLTSPDFTASDGYAHVQIRAEIFAAALQFHASRPVKANSSQAEQNAYELVRSFLDFGLVVAALQNLEQHWRKRDIVAAKTPTAFIVYHLLASRGYLMLRFSESAKAGQKSKPRQSSAEEFFKAKALWWADARYQFRVAPEVRKLPSAAELMNELDGMPLPVTGADVLFHRGLRFTRKDGLVGRASGPPGCGKTSLGLGVAVALAPLGTRTIYLSCEESPGDLTDRLQTLVHPFIRRTTSFEKDVSKWFEAHKVEDVQTYGPKAVIRKLNQIAAEIGAPVAKDDDCPPGLMPLCIILDGVHDLFLTASMLREQSAAREDLQALIERCRTLGAFVLLLSASGTEDVLVGVDYLVDFVLKLDHHAQSNVAETPARSIILNKTRRQISRPGAHVFHLSGSKGFRISPHIGSQLEAQRSWRWREPNAERVFDALLTGIDVLSGKRNYRPLALIYERSQILLTGEGSSGKAALALKLLTSPSVQLEAVNLQRKRRPVPSSTEQIEMNLKAPSEDEDEIPITTSEPEEHDHFEDVSEAADLWDSTQPAGYRRILVLSFLYQEAYYNKVWGKIRGARSADGFVDPPRPPRVILDVVSFSPGYLRPEDFLRIVSREIDRAELSGVPYHGVLIDGLHNVYLQFPNLEHSELVWALLYEHLRARGVTVVTTHTSFAIDQNAAYALQDLEASRRRIGPLLHALVQAADFSFRVDPAQPKKFKPDGKEKPISLKLAQVHVSAALGQPLRQSVHYWDRDAGVFRIMRTQT